MFKLGTAIRIAVLAHDGQTDKGQNPYILHPIAVMGLLHSRDHELMAMAILHDAKEDNPKITDEYLREEGMTERIIIGLDFLTHRKGEGYDDYIKRISTNVDAIRVKLADLTHNMDPTRMKGLRDKDMERLNKYMRAFAFLTQALENHLKVYPV